MSFHTVIPDIHADIDRLNASLEFAPTGGKILFLGDLIDAAADNQKPEDSSVLWKVKSLIEEEKAIGIMGNHELNALLFHRFNKVGPLRAHSEKNVKQHKSFIDKFGLGSNAAIEWTNWFLSALPLWQELDGLRLIHACWSQQQIEIVRKRRSDGYLKAEDLEEIANENTDFGRAVKILLTGPEINLPEPYTFDDYHGNKRKEVRLAWWNTDAVTWKEATLSVPNPDQLPKGVIPPEISSEIYNSDNPPVLVGHYKMKGKPAIDNIKAASLDYPKSPCVYKWFGENKLDQSNLKILT